MRVAQQGLIYRKVRLFVVMFKEVERLIIQILRLSSYSLTNYTSGKIMNLFSNDASQIEVAFDTVNALWVMETYWFFILS